MNYIKYIKSFPATSGYEFSLYDNYIEYDNYLCVIQTNKCNNIILVSTGKHKYTLLEDVKWIIEYAIKYYGIKLFLIDNKKWKYLLDRTRLVNSLYENERYCIYEKKDD